MKTLQQLKLNANPLPWWVKVLIAVLFLVFSFPKIDATYTFGLDPSYFYALNYFFNSGIQIGREVFWSYGPLSFIEIPLPIGHNLLISILFISIVSIIFSYTALTLGQIVNRKKWWFHLAIIFYACQACYVSDMLAGITAMAILIYHENKNLRWLVLVIIVSILALCIRSSTGIT
ncbi:MAG TPA: hypothetical protein VN922_10550, partial [Bacteroidia bacterium]|nr:hypothetical protein [Bacteroidia bacterium]